MAIFNSSHTILYRKNLLELQVSYNMTHSLKICILINTALCALISISYINASKGLWYVPVYFLYPGLHSCDNSAVSCFYGNIALVLFI